MLKVASEHLGIVMRELSDLLARTDGQGSRDEILRRHLKQTLALLEVAAESVADMQQIQILAAAARQPRRVE